MRHERGSAVKAMVLVSTVVAAAFLLTQRQKVASAAGSISTNTPLSGANTRPPRDTAALGESMGAMVNTIVGFWLTDTPDVPSVAVSKMSAGSSMMPLVLTLTAPPG